MRVSGTAATADVVVVGAGIVGVCTALFLAEADVPRVVVLEQATVGAGATGRAAGVILLQAESAAELRVQLESVALHRRLRDELGTDLQEHGSLLFWMSPDAAADGRARAAFHAESGVAVETFDAGEVRRRFPYLAAEDVALATFSARDPWATPLATLERIAAAARQRGVEIREHCAVTSIEVDAGRVCRVLTREGPVATPVVVNAAGAWARGIGELAGARVPVAPRKRQVFVLDPEGILPADAPFIFEEARDFYCKMRPEGLIMVCGQTPGETLEPTVEWGYLDDALGPTLRHIPGLRRARVTDAWAGIRPTSPDGQPLLGPVPDVEGYIVAGGLGSQGFARGPLVGQLVAELITTGQAHLDLTPYRPDRFARGARPR